MSPSLTRVLALKFAALTLGLCASALGSSRANPTVGDQLIAAQPWGHSYPLRDQATGRFLGASSYLCSPYLQDYSGFSYFATAAHVAETSERFAIEIGALRVDVFGRMIEVPRDPLPAEMVYIDSSRDLALFRVRTRWMAAIGCLSMGPLDEQLRSDIPEAYDIEALAPGHRRRLALESFDPATNSVVRYEYSGSVARSLASGLPGRDATGSLLMAGGPAIAGSSGGALVELRDGLAGARPRFLGLVLAYDPFGQKMALLPAQSIIDGMREFFRTPDARRASRRKEREAIGGTDYLSESGQPIARHLRGPSRWRPSGPADLLPGGPGRLSDSGPGRLSDSGPGRLSDSGPGRLSDSGPGVALAQWSSGIVRVREPDRRWLSIVSAAGEHWTEGEPFPLARRTEIESSRPLSGIYEERGASGLFATSGAVPLPRLFVASGFSESEPCAPTRGVLRTVGANSAARVASAVVCSFHTPDEVHFVLARAVSQPRAGQATAVEIASIRLTRRCALAGASPGGACPITIDAKLHRAHWRDVSVSELTSWRRRETPGVRLESDGFRTFANPGSYWLRVEETGGFEVRTVGAGGRASFVGPTL